MIQSKRQSAPTTPASAETGASTPIAAQTPLRGGLIALAYTVATIIMTWPYAARLGSAVPGGGDPLLQIWVGRWVQHALLTSPTHLYDANIFYPYATTLAYSDSNLPAALLAAPFFLLTRNPLLAYNLVVLGTFVLGAGGVYALVATLVGNRGVAFIAGLAFAFLPYRYAHIYHLNQLGQAWMPWALLALVLLIRHRSWGAAIACGLLTAITATTSFYLAFQLAFVMALIIVVALIVAPQTRSPHFLGQLLVAGLIATAIVLPLALPYLRVRNDLGLERTLREAQDYAAIPASYLKVQPENRFWSLLPGQGGGEDTLFPGGVVLVGALCGLLAWRRRPALTITALLVAILGLLLSLGPTWRPDQGGATALPYRFFFDHFPFFTAMRVTARFGALADLALVLLAASGLAWLWEIIAPRLRFTTASLAGVGATALLALVVMVELFSGPVALERIDRRDETAAPYRWLASEPGAGAVMEFPIRTTAGADRVSLLAMFWSTVHWKPLAQGYSGFIPPAYSNFLQTFIHDLRRDDGSIAKDVSYVDNNTVGLLQNLGIRYLVFHRQEYKREDWNAVLQRVTETGQVEAIGDFANVAIFRLREGAGGASTVQLAVVAPALTAPGVFWEPTVIARNRAESYGLLNIRRPPSLIVTWRDESGRQVRRDTLPVTLPLAIPPGELYCSVRLCPAASGVSAPPAPTGAASVRLAPDQPGRYTVQFDLTGDLPLSDTVTVEVVPALAAPTPDGPPLAFVSAGTDAGDYAPGSSVNLTLTWECRRPTTEDYTLFAQLIGPDGQVWGQYDAPAGWTSHYTTAWLSGEQVILPWQVPLKAGAPPGQYRLLIGMYRHTTQGVERIPLRYPGGDAPEFWVGEITVR